MAPQDTVPSELLLYLETYKVVVCTQCKYAVQPNSIARHLKEIHHILRGRRRPFMQHVSRLELDASEDVMNHKVEDFPVPSLPVLSGFQCRSRDCSHLCASEKRMRAHWTQDHGRVGYSVLDWDPAPIQTFFRGNLLRYFTGKIGRPPTDDIPSARAPGNELHVDQGICKLDEVDSAAFRHYSTSTYKYMMAAVELEHIWRQIVPTEAYRHSFLMHAILACTNLHIAAMASHDAEDYLVRAAAHMDAAIPLFRSAVFNASQDNSDAILAFTHFLALYSIASDNRDGLLFIDTLGNETLPLWMHFLRNGCVVLGSIQDSLRRGPLGPMLEWWHVPDSLEDIRETQLARFLLSAVPSKLSNDHWPSSVCDVYETATTQLVNAFWCTQKSDSLTTWDALRVWPSKISDDYMKLLRAEHPAALILLANYCVLLQRLDTLWYFRGRASSLLSSVKGRMDPKWHRFITNTNIPV